MAAAKAQLLPCPFCGTDVGEVFVEHWRWIIACPTCNIVVMDWDSEESAAARWNQRTPARSNTALLRKAQSRAIRMKHSIHSARISAAFDILNDAECNGPLEDDYHVKLITRLRKALRLE